MDSNPGPDTSNRGLPSAPYHNGPHQQPPTVESICGYVMGNVGVLRSNLRPKWARNGDKCKRHHQFTFNTQIPRKYCCCMGFVVQGFLMLHQEILWVGSKTFIITEACSLSTEYRSHVQVYAYSESASIHWSLKSNMYNLFMHFFNLCYM